MLGELSDTFGDDRRDIEFYEEYILNNERLLKIKAAERLRHNPVSRNVWDDVLQEGRLVQFTVLKKRPESTREYVSAAMSHRIVEVISRDQWTGSECKRGHPIDPLRRPSERDSVDDETLHLDEIVESSNWVDEVINAYHHGEIAQALDQLTFTQRQQVFARFWLGMSEPEIAAIQGVSVSSVSRRWTQEIKPRLVEELGHLVGTV
jgi:DNA-directed RNA polymerase specialized sigma24 family protein